MPIDFPASPATGQVYSYLGKMWQYNGTGWALVAGGQAAVNLRVFASSGSTAYTPTAGTKYAIVECIGSGAGGGGTATSSGNLGSGGGGGGGGYSAVLLSAAQIGASQTITIGSPGTGGNAGDNDGSSGAGVSFGSLCIANGGSQGAGSASGSQGVGGAGGSTTGAVGTITLAGGAGFTGAAITSGSGGVVLGSGGDAGGGMGKGGGRTLNAQAGPTGNTYGGGGGGGGASAASTQQAGGAGAIGAVIITEFLGGTGGPVGTVLPGYLYGMGTAVSTADATNDIIFSAGKAADSNGVFLITASSMIKQVDAVWAAGSSAGGRFSTTISSNATYHMYTISNGTVADFGFSTNATTPTGEAQYPAGYTYYRRIGSVVRVSSANVAYWQTGNTFILQDNVAERTDTATVAATLITLTSFPLGVSVQPIVSGFTVVSTGQINAISVYDARDTSFANAIRVCGGGGTGSFGCGSITGGFYSNTSGQIGYSFDEAITVTGSELDLSGWIDDRGQTAA